MKDYTFDSNRAEKVISVDISNNRISALKKTCEEYNLELITPTLYNYDTAFDISDKILIDAPCSGLATIGSKPDIIFHLKENDIKLLSEKQETILDFFKKFLKTNGRVVYSVCTFTAFEGKSQIDKFLQKNKNFRTINGVISSKYIHQDIIIENSIPKIDWVGLDLEPFFICCLEKYCE